MRLHKIRVEKISPFLLNKYSVRDFRLLPAYYTHQSLDKHNLERKIIIFQTHQI